MPRQKNMEDTMLIAHQDFMTNIEKNLCIMEEELKKTLDILRRNACESRRRPPSAMTGDAIPPNETPGLKS
ncbi:MAG: hypothetical protein HY885_07290 [Deltaproteobacteria bacterium]|nr:hypothetical protein [Deltaproteobacteria bacterium]